MERLNNPSSWSPSQRELLSWFQEKAAPLAGAYEGAVRLIKDEAFPGRIHFIAHAARDIADRLVFVLDPQLQGRRIQYDQRLDVIEEQWPEIKSIQDPNEGADDVDIVAIGYQVAVNINSLVQAHRERRKGPSNYELLFRFLMRNEPTQTYVNQRLVKDFKKVRNWFMEHTHLQSEESPPVNESELQSQFERFEGMLHSFVGHFHTGTRELDEILQQANQ